MKAFLIGERVVITAGTLIGLRGVVIGFGSSGNPILDIDRLFRVSVGMAAIQSMPSPANAYRSN
jgi:hypothetical protein